MNNLQQLSQKHKWLVLYIHSVDTITEVRINNTGYLQLEREHLLNNGYIYNASTHMWFPR